MPFISSFAANNFQKFSDQLQIDFPQCWRELIVSPIVPKCLQYTENLQYTAIFPIESQTAKNSENA